MPGGQGPGGPVDDRDAGQGQRGDLGPASVQELRAKDKVGQADDREDAALDHRDGVEQRRDRGGGDGCGGQPSLERKDRGLDAEPQKAQKIEGEQRVPWHGKDTNVEVPSQRKGRSRPVQEREDHGDEGAGRTADRVGQVLLSRESGAAIHGVHHQGQRGQGHQLVEEVEGQQIGGEGDAEHHAVGQGEPREEGVFPPLVPHVLEGIERRRHPEDRHERGEYHPQPVEAQRERQVGGDAEQRQRLQGSVSDQKEGKERVQRRDGAHAEDEPRPTPQPCRRYGERGDCGDEDGDKEEPGGQGHGQREGCGWHE